MPYNLDKNLYNFSWSGIDYSLNLDTLQLTAEASGADTSSKATIVYIASGAAPSRRLAMAQDSNTSMITSRECSRPSHLNPQTNVPPCQSVA
jgi:hypothetical protein